MAVVNEDQELRYKVGVFEDRKDAGARLAVALERFRGQNAVILAIPSGGVPVGLEISACLGLPFDLLIIRKIPIPGNPEAGLGAVSLEGDMVINEDLASALLLSRGEIEELAKPVREELKLRNRTFREGRPWSPLEGKIVILVDDGLASGYTMSTALSMVRRQSPLKVVVAVPTAPFSALDMIGKKADEIFCLNLRASGYFAVADAYRRWRDLSREEVVEMLQSRREDTA